MAKIPLRAYLHEIEMLIDRGQIDEAVAHCRHILQTLPKNLGSYRLLGKAFLETQRYSDAADIFRRVLSTVPDDFVAQVGMSIIREDEGNFDAAIWHMERAFEVQPYNSAIQNELRRLYGVRDGFEPPKVRLTRGALARMYARGDLYQQAISELRSALAEDSNRPDLQVMLARMYYLSGQRVEAVEVCSSLLKKLPFCLEANRIISAILPETERKDEAQAYQQKVAALDPYLAMTSPRQPNADAVPENVILVEKLDWHPGHMPAGGSSQPDWAASLGVNFQPETGESALPDWLSSSEDDFSRNPKEPETPTHQEWGNEMADTSLKTPSEIEQGEEPDENMGDLEDWMSAGAGVSAQSSLKEELPDWMKEAGWDISEGEEEAPPPLSEFAEDEDLASDEPAPGAIPDWLRAMAPPGAIDDTDEVDDISAEALLPWLDEAAAENQDNFQLDDSMSSEILTGINGSAIVSGEGVPDWLQGLGEGDDQEVVSAAEKDPGKAEGQEELPDWLVGAEAGTLEEAVDAEPEDELPDWLTDSQADASEFTELNEVEESVPDWLSKVEPKEDAGSRAQPADEIPAWLADMKTEEESDLPVQAADEIPDWLADLKPEAEVEPESPAAESQTVEPTPEAGIFEGMSLDDEDATMAWLESLAAKQGANEDEFISRPEDRNESLPEWLVEENETEGLFEEPATVEASGETESEQTDWLPEIDLETEPVDQTVTPAEPEIPTWLADIDGEVADDKESQVLESALPVEEIPEWLSELAPESDTEPDAVPGDIDTQKTETDQSGVFEGMSVDDEDATMAWLESLAAKQGASEDEFISRPEDRQETLPDWLSEGEPEDEPVSEPEIQSESDEQDWLAEAFSQAEAPVEAAEIESEETITEVPAWLSEIESEVEDTETTEFDAAELPDWKTIEEPVSQVQDTFEQETTQAGSFEGMSLEDEDATMAWLESLAAKQGASEDEFISQSADRSENLPTWVQEQTEQEAVAISETSQEEYELEDTQPIRIKAESIPAPEMDIEAEVPAAEASEIEAPESEALPESHLEEVPLEEIPMAEVLQVETPSLDESIPEEPWAEIPQIETPSLEEPYPDVTSPEGSYGKPPEVPSLDTPETQPAEEIIVPELLPVELETDLEAYNEATAEPELPEWLKEPVSSDEEEYAWTPPVLADERSEAEPDYKAFVPAEDEAPAYAPIDLNKASLVELENLPGIGFRLAQSILNYRSEAPFTEVEDLLQVPGFEPGLLDEIGSRLVVIPRASEPTPTPQPVPELAGEADRFTLSQARSALLQDNLEAGLKHYLTLIKQEQLLDEVTRDLQDALYRHPVDINILQALGDAYMRNNQLQEALEAYIRAEELLR